MKANLVPNCIRSESYMITFEVEEEKYVMESISVLEFLRKLFQTCLTFHIKFMIICRFPFFGKKYQLKFSSDSSAETHCLVHFPSLIRSYFYLLTSYQ